MSTRRGLFIPPFDELADPRLLMSLAADAEAAGWDGFFLWDHIVYSPPVHAVLDPWVAMAGIVTATERIITGPLITPLSRRRVHKLARETVTLDLLSRGRTVLGVGLGSDRHGELAPFGEVAVPSEQAVLLDEGLAKLQEYWSGTFVPRPVQQPRIPIWGAGRWPARKPVRRAVRLDGFFPIELPGPEALAELAAELAD
jgi:alkanesulfonate monooxygenase SsuD/methylene tetrahydromethanopterin reductase-like flavin-dependent oxidoreductase (luciferase family)